MRISDWSSDVCSSDLFGGAPVVNVEGRGYPVEVRYRALGSESLSPDDSSGRQFRKGESDSDPISVLDGILAACDEIARERPMGDTLVFLPGEREIRDAHQALEHRKYRHTEVLPLYARLSARDQDRVRSEEHTSELQSPMRHSY